MARGTGGRGLMGVLFALLQHLLPQHLLSRAAGWLAECKTPWLKNALVRLFIKCFDVNMAEAQEPAPDAYPTFNAFFTRALVAGARPIDPTPGGVVCPADGNISQLGAIEDGALLQAKGRHYSAAQLLADRERAAAYQNGRFATIYLSPKDYHRVHLPVAGTLQAQTYIPGSLFSVNQATAANVEGLFARNERLVCHFATEAGDMALVMVGAMIVAGIETVWGGQVAPAPRVPQTIDYRQAGSAPESIRQPESVSLNKGDEMGRFKLGSTVILLFSEGAVEWEPHYQPGSPTRMGELLGQMGGNTNT